MTRFVRYLTFEDAFFFGNEAKTIPLLASTEATIQRYLRVCVLLSWVALEEVVKDTGRELI